MRRKGDRRKGGGDFKFEKSGQKDGTSWKRGNKLSTGGGRTIEWRGGA